MLSPTHEIKDRLIQVLREKNITPKELSEKTGIPKSSISQYMSGYAKPKQDSKIDGFNKNCFIFGVNKPLSDTTIERKKNKWCKLANVKQIRIHDFRHSHASYLINNMPNDQNLILAISKRLGHSSPTTTMEIYAHMMPSDEDKILNILNKNS